MTANSGVTNISGGSVTTTGLEALGVDAEGGGNVTISGTSVTTTNDASKGLAVFGAGSSLAASNLTVTTQGTINSADGNHAYAVYNGYAAGTSYTSGGTVSLTDVTAKTSGANTNAIETNSGGVTTISGGSVTTAGPGSSGIFNGAGGVSNLSGGSVATSGQDAHALYATGAGSTANLSGTDTFATQGALWARKSCRDVSTSWWSEMGSNQRYL